MATKKVSATKKKAVSTRKTVSKPAAKESEPLMKKYDATTGAGGMILAMFLIIALALTIIVIKLYA